MKTYCLNCGNENPHHSMKTCSRKCIDELKKKNSRETRICSYCKTEFEVRKKDLKKLCSENCRKNWAKLPENLNSRIESSKNAVKEKFGVENVFQLECVKKKLKQTKKEKYGDENYNNSIKMGETKLEKYGDEYGKDWYKKMENNLIENYSGATHGLKIDIFKEKLKKTNLKNYGTEYMWQNKEKRDEFNETIKNKYGVENISQNEKIKQKKKKTSLKKFGVEHHLQDFEMFKKHQKSCLNVKKYKNTDINYIGTYELYFLEKMDKLGKIDLITNGEHFKYEWKGKEHVYYSDFIFEGKNIEIKSSWTYNKNGTDLELESINKAKWQSVVTSGKEIIVLIDKSSIDSFIINIS